MSDRRTRTFLTVMAAAMVVAAITYLATPRRDPTLATKPADWLAATHLAETALDSRSPSRFAAWRAAHELAVRLAPNRAGSSIGFVRAGLFHWYELPEADRRVVLAEATRLMQDPQVFGELYMPLLQLTGDFAQLVRMSPKTYDAAYNLRNLAATTGHFAEYSKLRAETSERRLADFRAGSATLTQPGVFAFVPSVITSDDDVLVREILDELHRRPLDTEIGGTPNVDILVDYALRHNVQPLDGVEVLVRTPGSMADPERARLAVRLGRMEQATDIEISSRVVDPQPWALYHVERAIADVTRGERDVALLHLNKAIATGITAEVANGMQQVASLAGDSAAMAQAHEMLVSRFSTASRWTGLCGVDLCASARTDVFSVDHRSIAIVIETVQTDEVPPYVEIFVDDARVAEGPLDPKRTFDVPLSPGLNRIDVRLVNPLTRNLVHRRAHIL